MHLAVESGNLALVQVIANIKGINLDPRDKDGWSPFLIAACHNHEGIVKFLAIKAGVDLNPVNSSKKNPFHFAAKRSDTTMIELLTSMSAVNIDKPNAFGFTPLLEAIRWGRVDNAIFLAKQKGVDLNARTLGQEMTPLSFAAAYYRGSEKWISLVRFLVKQDSVDIFARDVNGQTALYWARERENEEAVEILEAAERSSLERKKASLAV